MNKEEVKKLYKEIEATKRFDFVGIAQEVIKILKLDCLVDDIIYTVIKLEGEELKAFIDKHKLSCPVCKTADHLVCEPVVWDTEMEQYTKKFEIYCNNSDPNSSIFSKCWHHVYAYIYGTQHSIGKSKCLEL